MTIYEEIRKYKAEGKYFKAWQTGFTALEKDPFNNGLKNSLFWVIYAALKQVIEPIQKRQYKTPLPNEQNNIDDWVGKLTILKLPLPNDNIDYRLWNLFKDVGKYCEPLCIFILKSGRTLFTKAEYEPYTHEKGESPSKVLKLARMVAANLLVRRAESSLQVDKVIGFIDYAMSQAKDSPKNKIWLEYDRAKIFAAFGEMEKARVTYLSVLKQKRTETWAWIGLGETYTDEPNKAISIIAHGLSYAHDPKFAIPGLILISTLLAKLEEYELASKILIRLTNIYEENGWPLRDSIVELMANEWFDASLDLSSLNNQLCTLADGAVEYTVEEPVIYNAVVERLHKSGKGITAYINRTLQIPIRKSLFKDRELLIPGSFIKVLCDKANENNQAVAVEELAPFESEDVCCFQGKIKITEKGYGFVNEKIFIPPDLADSFKHAVDVTGIAIISFNEKKQIHAWKAVTLKCI